MAPRRALSRTLLARLIEEAAHHGAGLVELRCTVPVDLPVAATGDKVNLFLPLPKDPGRLWSQLDAKVRNQVRKAERSGLSVEFGQSERLDDFYETFARNMRDLGSPVHARGFFQAILDAFGDQARIALVRKDGQPIGGLIALAFKDSLIVPWASSLRQYLSLCPNMLLYWETLRSACIEGFQRFDFGRSSRNSGTYRFKRQWGAVEEPLFWYTIPIASLPTPKAIERGPESSTTGSTLAISPFACHTMAWSPHSEISDPVDRMVYSRRSDMVSCFHQVLASHELGGAGLIALGLASELKGRGQVSHVWIPGEGPAQRKAQALGLPVHTYSSANIFSASKFQVVASNVRIWRQLRLPGRGLFISTLPSITGHCEWLLSFHV